MKSVINKTSLLMILIILSLGQTIFSIMGCIQENMGGNKKMPFQDLGISDGENELFYAGVINIRNYRAIGDGTTDDYNALNSAIQNASNKTLLIPSGTYRIASSLTVPSNVNILFANGAKIKPDSGKTLTINGRLTADRYQIFDGDGTVNIAKGACDELYPEWWGAVGDGSTDDTTALQKCITCASQDANVKVVKLGERTYKITSALTTAGNATNIVGVSMNRSWILVSGGCDGLRIAPAATGNQREQILLSNFRIYSDSVVTGYGIYIQGHRDLTIDHVWIGGYYDNYKGFEYGIYATNQPTYYLRILNSRIFYCKYGIYITGSSNNAVIEHNTIRYGVRLITIDGVGGCRIINNSIETDSGATSGGNPATERLVTLTNNANNTVIANNYLEHHSNQTIEIQSGCTRTRIYGNSHAVWLYDKSDVLDNSGNDTNSYDDKVVFRINKDTNNYTTDNVGGIIDITRGNVSDQIQSGDWHPADMRIRAKRGYLTLNTEANNRQIELMSHTDARTFNTPFGGFGKSYGNLIKYSEAFNNWHSGIYVEDNCVVSPTGESNASRYTGRGVSVGTLGDAGYVATDGDIVIFSVWLRNPEANKQKGQIIIGDGTVAIGKCYCEITNEWRRYSTAGILYRGVGPYKLWPTIYTGYIFDSQENHTIELFGAQLNNMGQAISGTVDSKITPTSSWMMDYGTDFCDAGVNVGSLVEVFNGSSCAQAYVNDIESCLGFAGGNGTQPSVGDTVSVTSTNASGVITQVVVESGSFANGNAVGWLRIKNLRNNFSSSDTLTFPNATATCDYFSRNCVLKFVNDMWAIYGGKSSCSNGDTYYIAPKEKIVPQPYVRANGSIITCEEADFYASKVVTSGLKASLGSNLTLGNYNIHISSSPTADKWSGLTITLTAGENLALGDACYMNSSGKMVKADADSISTAGVIAIATETINSESNGTFLLQGVIHLHTLAPNWTIGGKVYLSTDAGGMTQTAPSGADDVIQILGTAIASDTLLFNPNSVMIEHN